MQRNSIPQYSKAVQVELIEYLRKNKFESFFNFHTWQNAQLHLEAEFSNDNQDFYFCKLKNFFCNCLIYKIYDKTYSFLSQKDIYYFCYPFLKNIHHIVLIFETTPEYPILSVEKVRQHCLFIKYTVDNNFDLDVWNEFEKFNNYNLRNEININLNNTQYGLDNSTKKLILSQINKKHRKRKIAHNESLGNQLPVWLSKLKKTNVIQSSAGTSKTSNIGNSNINGTPQQEFTETFITESQIQQIEKEINLNQNENITNGLDTQKKSKVLENKTYPKPVVIEKTKIVEQCANLPPQINTEPDSANSPETEQIIILDDSSSEGSENEINHTKQSAKLIERNINASPAPSKIFDSDSQFELPDFIYECWNWRQDNDIILVEE